MIKLWWLPADSEGMTNLFTIGFDMATPGRDYTVYRCAGCDFATMDPDTMGRHLKAHVSSADAALFNERRGSNGDEAQHARVRVDVTGQAAGDCAEGWAGSSREGHCARMDARRSESSRAQGWRNLAGRSWQTVTGGIDE